MATTRIILNLDGSVIDKTNGHITANSQYAHKIQVISPFPSSDSLSLEWYLRNARITTYSQYIGLFKDDSGDPILAGAIVDSSKEYYQTIKEWYVWQVPIDSQALAAISRYHAGKVSLTVKFKEFRNLYIEEAITDKGTFGSRKSTTTGDLPASATEGDYYVCDFLDYYSVITEEDYTLADYAYYTDSAWLKGVAYMYRLNTSAITLSVDASILGQDLESVSVSTGELLAAQIAALESVILGELPADYAAGLFVRKEFDLNYTELSPLPTDQILIERNRDTYYTDLADIMLGVDELESDIIRTHNAISATEGTGLYADATDVVIGSATGDGISWSSTLGLFFRGTIQSGTITDAGLLAELKGDTGDTGATGETGTGGAAGPGLVFKGDWVADTNYYYDSSRRDIVFQSGTYYAVKVVGTLNESIFSTDDWTVMTSFAAVATDLLLAQDVTILKGLVMGAENTADGGLLPPFIRSVNKNSIEDGTGFYIAGNGTFGIGGDGDNCLIFDGTDLEVKGIITADSLIINSDTSLTNEIVLGTGGILRSLSKGDTNPFTDPSDGFVIDSDGHFIFGFPDYKHISWDGEDLEVIDSYVPFKVNSIEIVGATEATVNVTVTNAWGGGSYLSVSAVESGDADSWVGTGNSYSSGSHTFDINTSHGDFGYGKMIDLKFRFGTSYLSPTTSKESDSQTIIMPTPTPHLVSYSSVAGWPETDLTSQFGGASKTPVSSTVSRIDLAITFMLTDDITNGEVITTIPTGYRPITNVIFGLLGNNPGTDYSTASTPYFKIDTNGDITIDDTLDTTEEPITIMATYFV